MAAPNLQAQGATSAVTSGAPAVVIPTHQTDDIIVIAAIFWGPNTAGDAAQIPTPANYTLIGSQVGQPAGTRDGWLAWFWRRAPAAGSTVTLTVGAGWDSGTDTCYGARAYVIRGCAVSGDPWDAAVTSGPHTAANQAFPAVTVSGIERMVAQLGNVTDNLAFAMTSAGWTTGTEDNDPAGTDCSFQTARKDNVSASTSADTATVTAPAAGAYAFMGISFKPPLAAALFEAAVNAVGTVVAAITTVIRMASDVLGAAILAAALSTNITPVAAVSGTAVIAAPLVTEIRLGSAVAGNGTTTADLTAPQQSLLVADVVGVGTVAGTFSTEIRLASGVSGSAATAAPLSTAITPAAGINGAAAITGFITTEVRLASGIVGAGTTIAGLTTEVRFASGIVGAGTTTADLTVSQQSLFMADVVGTGTVVGAFDTEIVLYKSSFLGVDVLLKWAL